MCSIKANAPNGPLLSKGNWPVANVETYSINAIVLPKRGVNLLPGDEDNFYDSPSGSTSRQDSVGAIALRNT